MRSLGLRAHIFTSVLLPILLISVILVVVFFLIRSSQLEHAMLLRGVSITESTAVLIEVPLSEKNTLLAKKIINTIHRKNAPIIKSINIVSCDNSLFATSNHYSGIHILDIAEYASCTHSKLHYYNDSVIICSPIWLDVSTALLAPVNEPCKILGYVTIHMDLKDLQTFTYGDISMSIAITCLALLMGLFFVFHLNDTITRPIYLMIHAVESIRNGRLATRLPGTWKNELEVLRVGINELVTSLEKFQNEMQQNIDQATLDLRETLEHIEIQNVELDLAKQKAQQAVHAKSAFLANMSHELRTPLNGVLGFTRQLLKIQKTHPQVEYLQAIEKSAQNLLNIISNILDFSKLEAGKLTLSSHPFSLREAIYSTIQVMGPLAYEKQLELIVDIDVTVPDHLIGDELRMQQIITNLVGNAIKFTERGEVVLYINTKRMPHPRDIVLHFCVLDTGIGIDLQKKKNLFEAFVQGDNTAEKRYQGTGLGLVITERLIKQMNGHIQVISVIAQGSQFSFDLKFLASCWPMEQWNPLSKWPASKRVMIYESNKKSSESLEKFLSYLGMSTTICADEKAFKEILMTEPECIFIGHNPRESIDELVPRVKEACSNTTLVCVLLNSHDPTLIEKIQSLGTVTCYSKPFNPLSILGFLTQTPTIYPQNEDLALAPEKYPLTVLAVDDNAVGRKLITTMLESKVEHVMSCDSGKKALELTKKYLFDIIFMDVQMPILDGIETARYIRQKIPLNAKTMVVAVTAYVLPGDRAYLLEQGMSAYLAKPVQEEKLLSILRNFVHKSLHVLDWKTCLRMAAGQEKLAQDILKLLLTDLDEFRPLLMDTIDGKVERDTLKKALHKLHGGCVYSGVYELQQHLKHTEQFLNDGYGINEIKEHFYSLLEAIDRLKLTITNKLNPCIVTETCLPNSKEKDKKH